MYSYLLLAVPGPIFWVLLSLSILLLAFFISKSGKKKS